MKVNLAKFSIEADDKFVRLYPVSHEMIAKSRETGKDYDASPRYLVLSHAEAQAAVLCLRGSSRYAPYFDDGIHLIKFTPGGMREVYLNSYISGSGGKYEEFWFHVPGAWLAQKIETALRVLIECRKAGKEERYQYTATNGELSDVADSVAPSFIWRYGENVQAKLNKDLADGRQEGLQQRLDGLKAIAENYSHGKPSIIWLRFEMGSNENDDKPSDYYFYIENDGSKVINGGIIAHKDHSDGDKDAWKYSTHT